VDGEPFYPIPTIEHRELYLKYKSKAETLKSVLFCGRLAEYQYYNMDQVVANTLKKFEDELQ
jgi:UDP-galactopyranose mutase